MKNRAAICVAIICLSLVLPGVVRADILRTDQQGRTWTSEPPYDIWYLVVSATVAMGYERQDTNSRLVVERRFGGRSVFYAWKDGSSKLVGAGTVSLRAGHTYTFVLLPLMKPPIDLGALIRGDVKRQTPVQPGEQEVEVRRTSTNQLLGYALLVKSSTKSRRVALEKPVQFVDSNGDGLVSISELDSSLERLQKEASAPAGLPPSVPARLATDSISVKDLIKKGFIELAYQQVRRMEIGLAQDIKIAKKQAVADQVAKELAARNRAAEELVARNQAIMRWVGTGLAAVILFGMAFILLLRWVQKHSGLLK